MPTGDSGGKLGEQRNIFQITQDSWFYPVTDWLGVGVEEHRGLEFPLVIRDNTQIADSTPFMLAFLQCGDQMVKIHLPSLPGRGALLVSSRDEDTSGSPLVLPLLPSSQNSFSPSTPVVPRKAISAAWSDFPSPGQRQAETGPESGTGKRDWPEKRGLPPGRRRWYRAC